MVAGLQPHTYKKIKQRDQLLWHQIEKFEYRCVAGMLVQENFD